MNEMNNGKNQEIQAEVDVRFWSLVGDNGFGITCFDGIVLDAIQRFRNISIMEMPSEEAARRYAYAAYYCRFVMRNFMNGAQAKIPVNLPLDVLFFDPDFEAREGNRRQLYFPGIPM